MLCTAKNSGIMSFKRVNFMVYEVYLNKTVTKKKSMVFISQAPNSCQIFHQCILLSFFRHILRGWYSCLGLGAGQTAGVPSAPPPTSVEPGCFSELSACIRGCIFT